jgi:hypothetical protein
MAIEKAQVANCPTSGNFDRLTQGRNNGISDNRKAQ